MEINEPNGWIELNTPRCDANEICFFINNHNKWPMLTRVDTSTRAVSYLSKADQTVLSFYGTAADGVRWIFNGFSLHNRVWMSRPLSAITWRRHRPNSLTIVMSTSPMQLHRSVWPATSKHRKAIPAHTLRLRSVEISPITSWLVVAQIRRSWRSSKPTVTLRSWTGRTMQRCERASNRSKCLRSRFSLCQSPTDFVQSLEWFCQLRLISKPTTALKNSRCSCG